MNTTTAFKATKEQVHELQAAIESMKFFINYFTNLNDPIKDYLQDMGLEVNERHDLQGSIYDRLWEFAEDAAATQLKITESDGIGTIESIVNETLNDTLIDDGDYKAVILFQEGV